MKRTTPQSGENMKGIGVPLAEHQGGGEAKVERAVACILELCKLELNFPSGPPSFISLIKHYHIGNA